MTPLPSVKVLLVDDREENLVALAALLRREGLELLTARSGSEALELLLVHNIALALLDVQMPEMDGFELAELMRGTERTRRVPIIFLTAGAHDARRVFHGYEVGAVDFLFKPLDPVLLGHKMDTFVELHRQRLVRQQCEDDLREVLRLNETFVAAVSHDLRSPLSVVVMGAALLDQDLTTPDARRTLERVRSSASRMTSMLDQLIDLAQARLGGGVHISPREMNFRTFADKFLDEMRLAHPDRLLTIAYDDSATAGVWDEGRLGQVLANLIGNALRHGTCDEGVQVRVRGDASTLTVEVHNGGAIPVDLRSHLFDPFRSGTQALREGLGLGLYIVQQIVLAHGGTIDVSSSRDAGTTFCVRLPKVVVKSER